MDSTGRDEQVDEDDDLCALDALPHLPPLHPVICQLLALRHLQLLQLADWLKKTHRSRIFLKIDPLLAS
jgi:hypothetical protein